MHDYHKGEVTRALKEARESNSVVYAIISLTHAVLHLAETLEKPSVPAPRVDTEINLLQNP